MMELQEEPSNDVPPVRQDEEVVRLIHEDTGVSTAEIVKVLNSIVFNHNLIVMSVFNPT